MTETSPDTRRRGRPRAAPSVSFTIRLPVSLYDAYAQLAVRRQQSMSELVRDLMQRHAPGDRSSNASVAARAASRARHLLS